MISGKRKPRVHKATPTSFLIAMLVFILMIAAFIAIFAVAQFHL